MTEQKWCVCPECHQVWVMVKHDSGVPFNCVQTDRILCDQCAQRSAQKVAERLRRMGVLSDTGFVETTEIDDAGGITANG